MRRPLLLAGSLLAVLPFAALACSDASERIPEEAAASPDGGTEVVDPSLGQGVGRRGGDDEREAAANALTDGGLGNETGAPLPACAGELSVGRKSLPVGSLARPGSLATNGDDLYMAAHYGGAPMVDARIVRCPGGTCTATSTTFGTPTLEGLATGLAVIGDKVYWTEKNPGGGRFEARRIVRAELDGSNPTTVYELADNNTDVGAIGYTLAVSGTSLVFAMGRRDFAGVNHSGIVRLDTTTLTATTIPLTAFDPHYAWGVRVAADGDNIAYWQSIYNATRLEDRPDGVIRIYNGAGQLRETVGPFEDITGLTVADGKLVVWSGEKTQESFVCAIGACGSQRHVVPSSRFTPGVAKGGQLYFTKVRGSCTGTQVADFALVRCSLADAMADKCSDPTPLSQGLFLANAKRIAVGATKVYVSSLIPTDVAVVPLP